MGVLLAGVETGARAGAGAGAGAGFEAGAGLAVFAGWGLCLPLSCRLHSGSCTLCISATKNTPTVIDRKEAHVTTRDGNKVADADRLQAAEAAKVIPSARSMMLAVIKLIRPSVEGVAVSLICILRSWTCPKMMRPRPSSQVLTLRMNVSCFTPIRCRPSVGA